MGYLKTKVQGGGSSKPLETPLDLPLYKFSMLDIFYHIYNIPPQFKSNSSFPLDFSMY